MSNKGIDDRDDYNMIEKKLAKLREEDKKRDSQKTKKKAQKPRK